jgi:hypothetical protein
MEPVLPYANILAAVLILIIGLGFHWLGQAITVFKPDLAIRLGILEKDLLPEFRAYEDAIAKADVIIGWIYPLAAIGLLMGACWGARLAFFPGAIFVYHGLSAWFWETNRRRLGHRYFSEPFRRLWCFSNIGAGVLVILVAWQAT